MLTRVGFSKLFFVFNHLRFELVLIALFLKLVVKVFYFRYVRSQRRTEADRVLMKFSKKAITAVVIATFLLPSGGQAYSAIPKADKADYIVVFAENTDSAIEVAKAKTKGLAVKQAFTKAVSGMVVSLSSQQLTQLSRQSNVVSIELDSTVAISETQINDLPWGLDRIDQRALPLDQSYSYSSNAGTGVSAYIIDTGVLPTHSDLVGRVTTGWSAIGGVSNSADCNGHGTHVAGTVAGTKFGVAKSATIVPVRVLDCSGSGTTSGVIAGIEWVIGNHQVGTPAVANLSLGGGASSAMDTAIQSLTNDGVTVVVAAGNSKIDACKSSPARAPSALTVAASNLADEQASFSNFGKCVDIFAPGVDIVSSWWTSNFATARLSGTSMASPHVAGVAAVLLGQQPTSTPADVTAMILANASQNLLRKVRTSTPNKLIFTVAVVEPPPVPVPTLAASGGNGTAGTYFETASPSASNFTCDPRVYDYSLTGTLPDGLVLDTTTGVISGTPSTSMSSTNYTLTASCGLESAGAVIVIEISAASVSPDAPYNLTATAVKRLKANLTWQQGSSGGSALTRQTIYVYQGGILTATLPIAANLTSVQIQGLTRGQVYTFRVSATNASGTGQLSTESAPVRAFR